ncbi:MAG: hydroxyphenylacetyl-CoA thioesterase PaaI [Streptosporangiaceae bacterium]
MEDSVRGEGATALARRCAAAMYAADDASRQLGIEIKDVEPGRATARIRVASTMVNGHGMAHGGYVFLLADTAFAFACNTYGHTTVARSAEVVFVAPVREGDELVASAAERISYGRSGVYDVTVRRADGGVVAEFRGQSHTTNDRLVPDEGPS